MTHVRSIGLATGVEGPLTAELAAAAGRACRVLGIAVDRVATPEDADRVDVVLGIAYPHYYPVFRGRTIGRPRIAWLGEPLPPADDSLADRLVRPLPMGRMLDVVIPAWTVGRRRTTPPWMVRWRERAAFHHDQRFNLAAHVAAARRGIQLIVTSSDRAATLGRRGIAASVVPYGYDEELAGAPADPGIDRDIDVLILGTMITRFPTRRARITAEVLRQLDPTVRVVVVEDGLWGHDRCVLMRRARLVLNIQRVPGNFTGIRSMLAAAAGAVVVSEPVTWPSPFVPGVHYVEAPPAGLADAIGELLAGRERRLAIGRAAQDLVVHDLTMTSSMERLLEAIA